MYSASSSYAVPTEVFAGATVTAGTTSLLLENFFNYRSGTGPSQEVCHRYLRIIM
jgi:hypothetical protein